MFTAGTKNVLMLPHHDWADFPTFEELAQDYLDRRDGLEGGMRKTDDDVRRERRALDISGTLVGTGMSVSASKSDGPFVLKVAGLDEDALARVIRAVFLAAKHTPAKGTKNAG